MAKLHSVRWVAVGGQSDGHLEIVDQAPNPDQFNRRIKAVSVQMVADLNSVFDFTTLVFRKDLQGLGDNDDVLVEQGWDHYANPTEPAIKFYPFGHDHFDWPPGTFFSVGVSLSPGSGSGGSVVVHGQINVRVYYTCENENGEEI